MRFLLILFTVTISTISYSQVDISRDVFGAAGAEMMNGNLQLNFTLGETFTSTFNNTEIHTLGFQQADKSTISVVELIPVQIGLYPNPADDQITFISSIKEPFTYRVFDVTGRVVFEDIQQQSLLTLNVSHLVEGKYFFEYSTENQSPIVMTFITVH